MFIIDFFDYVLFRSYKQYEKKEDLPMLGSIMYVHLSIMSLFSFVWIDIPKLFCDKMTYNKYIIYSITLIIVGLIYKKRKIYIFKRYQHSKYNETIPNWTIWIVFPISFIIGVSIMLLFDIFIIERYHLEGIIGRWFCDTIL